MTRLLNPYIAGAPVLEPSMFFGRQDVFDWIEHSLTGKFADHILVIHGQRRVGKTSVLKQIPNHFPTRYLQVYFDLQGRTQTTLDRFLWWMSREILRALRSLQGVTIPAPQQAAFSEDNEYFHAQFLPALKPFLGDRSLLLTFDEFDLINQADTLDSLGKPLADYLSRLFELENLNFIFSIGSSGKKLENMQAAYTQFFKSALYKKISFLDQAECYQLITRPVKGTLVYDPGAVERIYQVTSGHPYYTQLTCHELFSLSQKAEKTRLSRLDVETVLPDVVERGTVNLKFVWDEASDLEKWALACLAQPQDALDPAQLSSELSRQRVRFSEPDLASALLHLQEKDVIRPDGSFVVHLMRLWLQTNRPVERVRQELVEINPIANRLIEIGDEYKERGSLPEAVQSYQQALTVDPGNLRALVRLGSIHVAQCATQEASDTYERALSLDPEDILARSGFCRAQMALGEEALSKGDSAAAIDHLRRVVEINPDHGEVRQRLADILSSQAEDLLASGQDEGALKAFHTAHHYTPDDEALLNRYGQVSSQVKGKVLASLLEKSSAEWKRKEWRQAISHLEDYLQLEPEAHEVRTKLADLRRQHHHTQLADCRLQAESMARLERWDEAALAWQEYLDLEPDDGSEAELALRQAQRSQALAETYQQAQTAAGAKDFPQAIQLFQSIIAQEPSYKDAARLLAGAIVAARRRKPVWLKPWAWAAFVLVLVAAMTAVFGRGALDYLRAQTSAGAFPLAAQVTATGSLQAPTTTPDPGWEMTQTAAAIAAQTSSTPTPSPAPSWIASFAMPLLEKIEGKSPDFADDFSTEQAWVNSYGMPVQKVGEIQGGRYRMNAAGGKVSQELPRVARDFVLEVEYQPADFSITEAVLSLALRGDENGNHYRFEIDPSQESYQVISYFVGGSDVVLDRGNLPGFGTQSTTVTNLKVIASGDRMAFLWNDAPLASVSNNLIKGAINAISLTATNGNASLEIDHVKLWDLYPVELPTWIDELALPALASIRNRAPDFEDDFSRIKSEWILDRGGSQPVPLKDHVSDGIFRLEPGYGGYNFSLYATKIQAQDFVLQLDFGIENFVNDRDRFFVSKSNKFRFGFMPYNNECWAEGSGNLNYGEVDCRLNPSKELNRLLLISRGDQFGVYLNGKPLVHYGNIPSAGLNNRLWFSSSEFQVQFTVDNVKFWKLEAP